MNNNNNGCSSSNGYSRGGQGGCQVYQDGVRCGETKTLTIIQEFKQLYEDKMRIIDQEGSGDCSMQAKICLQQDWIRDLTEQNEMLVRAVEELEQEATERVLALEEKLKQSAKCACERNGMLENDVQNLLELIRRVKEGNSWCTEGLKFCTVNKDDLIRGRREPDRAPPDILPDDKVKQAFKLAMQIANNMEKGNINSDENFYTLKLLEEKEKTITELQRELEKISRQTTSFQDSVKDTQIATLKQSMLDMRDALTAEVADKHDTIVVLRRDVQILEDQCRKADQQTHFKDDIIKELRKELKQLKSSERTKANIHYVSPIESKSRWIEPNQANYISTDTLIDNLTKKCAELKKNLELDVYPNKIAYFISPRPSVSRVHLKKDISYNPEPSTSRGYHKKDISYTLQQSASKVYLKNDNSEPWTSKLYQRKVNYYNTEPSTSKSYQDDSKNLNYKSENAKERGCYKGCSNTPEGKVGGFYCYFKPSEVNLRERCSKTCSSDNNVAHSKYPRAIITRDALTNTESIRGYVARRQMTDVSTLTDQIRLRLHEVSTLTIKLILINASTNTDYTPKKYLNKFTNTGDYETLDCADKISSGGGGQRPDELNSSNYCENYGRVFNFNGSNDYNKYPFVRRRDEIKLKQSDRGRIKSRIPAPVERTPVPVDRIPVPVDRIPVPDHRIPVPVDRIPVPVDRILVPVDRIPVPVDSIPVPVDRIPVPVDRIPVPVDRIPEPVDRIPVPVDRIPVPVDRIPVPVDRIPVPVDRIPVPVDKSMVPADKTPVPANKTSVPVYRNPVPVDRNSSLMEDGFEFVSRRSVKRKDRTPLFITDSTSSTEFINNNYYCPGLFIYKPYKERVPRPPRIDMDTFYKHPVYGESRYYMGSKEDGIDKTERSFKNSTARDTLIPSNDRKPKRIISPINNSFSQINHTDDTNVKSRRSISPNNNNDGNSKMSRNNNGNTVTGPNTNYSKINGTNDSNLKKRSISPNQGVESPKRTRIKSDSTYDTDYHNNTTKTLNSSRDANSGENSTQRKSVYDSKTDGSQFRQQSVKNTDARQDSNLHSSNQVKKYGLNKQNLIEQLDDDSSTDLINKCNKNPQNVCNNSQVNPRKSLTTNKSPGITQSQVSSTPNKSQIKPGDSIPVNRSQAKTEDTFAGNKSQKRPTNSFAGDKSQARTVNSSAANKPQVKTGDSLASNKLQVNPGNSSTANKSPVKRRDSFTANRSRVKTTDSSATNESNAQPLQRNSFQHIRSSTDNGSTQRKYRSLDDESLEEIELLDDENEFNKAHMESFYGQDKTYYMVGSNGINFREKQIELNEKSIEESDDIFGSVEKNSSLNILESTIFNTLESIEGNTNLDIVELIEENYDDEQQIVYLNESIIFYTKALMDILRVLSVFEKRITKILITTLRSSCDQKELMGVCLEISSGIKKLRRETNHKLIIKKS